MIKYFSILILCTSCAGGLAYDGYEESTDICNGDAIYDFDDGLPKKPNFSEVFNVMDKSCIVDGVSRKDTFFIDMDADRKKEKIIRGTYSRWDDLGYYFYEIYADDRKIADLRTIDSVSASLEAYRFQLNPFVLIKASRPSKGSWFEGGWQKPTQAKIEKFQIINDKLEKISESPGGVLCDVRELLL
ncbi:MAG: hypothetical protein LBJ73_02155 [Rickettsiales bacterium]|nr:hypothetical protein [Rickettsiales bacterium]